MKKFLSVIAFFILTFSAAHAQEVIKGAIKDDSGEPLPGATIVIKGTNTHTVSDVEGQFSIPAAKEFPFTLLVNLTGYKSSEVEVYEVTGEDIEVSLNNDNVLEEIVVVGYGEQKRKDITGSVASV